jgi:hypothetical protein
VPITEIMTKVFLTVYLWQAVGLNDVMRIGLCERQSCVTKHAPNMIHCSHPPPLPMQLIHTKLQFN